MRPGRDYRHVRLSEMPTLSSEGVALDRTVPVHFCKTDGGEDLNVATLVDGLVDGERHLIMIVSLGHANDSFIVTPASRPAGDYISWAGVKAIGNAVQLIWDATTACWQICGGNAEPQWTTAG